MKVIYEKETNRVLITEIDGVWVFPNELDIATVNEEALTYDEEGNIYLKAEWVN